MLNALVSLEVVQAILLIRLLEIFNLGQAIVVLHWIPCIRILEFEAISVMLNKSQCLSMDSEEERDTIKSLKMFALKPIHGNSMTIRALLNVQVKRQLMEVKFCWYRYHSFANNKIDFRIINHNDDHPTTTLRLMGWIGYEYPETPSSLTTSDYSWLFVYLILIAL